MTPTAKTQLVKTIAREVGFDLVGVTRPQPLPRAGYYRHWLAAGYGGTMRYLARNVHIRLEPGLLLPGARSIVCVALNYRRSDGYLRPSRVERQDRSVTEATRPTGCVAQYARGRDYHVVMHDLLEGMVTRLRGRLSEPFDARIFVDTGPLLERELAAAAGLGWFGKNTCLINPELGSYLLLAQAITTLELAADGPSAERCGECTRCMAACPTGALRGPRELDASRCLAYLTIEQRGSVAEEFHAAFGDRVFGCDVCQQVCPYNAHAPLATNRDIAADVVPARLDLLDLLVLRSGEYRRLVAGSAARRARRGEWRRNAAIALGNVAEASDEIRRALRDAAHDEDEALRGAASSSLRRLDIGRPES